MKHIKRYYRFKVGEFDCVCLSDGGYDYPLQKFFANVPTEHVEQVLRQRNLPTDYVWTPYTFLVVNTGEHQVLVDTGAGKLFPTTGQLLHSMEAAGIAPTDIDAVFITHAHPDHISGILDDTGHPVYANAHYFIWNEEWSFWSSEQAFDIATERHVTIARNNLDPVQDRMTLVHDESDIFPGIHVMAAPGHTPGHMVVSFSSGGDELLYIGDTVLYPLHLEYLDWLPVFDLLPDKAASSKRRIFDYAAERNTWVIGQHFPPFPSLGRIVKAGEGWQWRPIEPHA